MSIPTGRFAPTPSGRLHLGNVLCAMLAYLSVRSKGGRFLLRIEDVDVPRCPRRLAQQAIDDLTWLGFTWDEAPLYQSERSEIYRAALDRLTAIEWPSATMIDALEYAFNGSAWYYRRHNCCSFCGNEFKGFVRKVCRFCHRPKDY